MAAKNTSFELKGIISVFKILSNTDRSKVADLRPNAANTNSFDDLLILNLSLLWKSLESDEILENFGSLKTYFCGYFAKKSSGTENSCIKNEVEDTSISNNYEQNSCPSLEEKQLNNGSTIRWIFCQLCLQSLRILKSTLQAMKSSENSAQRPAVDLLSISDQQIVKTVIQLVVVFAICPNLLPGVGIPMDQRSGFSHVLTSGKEFTRCPKCLYECIMTLVSCLNEPSLSLLILSKHLGDVLVSLMQLGYCRDVCRLDSCIDHNQSATDKHSMGQVSSSPNSAQQGNLGDNECQKEVADSRIVSQVIEDDCDLSKCVCEGGILIFKEQQEECKKALSNIVDKIYQPLIVRELLFLQGRLSGRRASGKPKWMGDVCGHLLSRCLIKKNGVQSVLRAVLEGVSGANEWKVCEAIAQLIANCPIQMQSPEEYYRSISPQVLSLLRLPSSKLQVQYSRASVLIIHAMLRKYPEIATKCISDPLTRAFLQATREPEKSSKTVLVDEREMTCCIESLHKVFVASPNSSEQMTESIAKIIVPVFELFCFVRHSVSHLKTALLELLSTFFKRTKNLTALAILYAFISKERPNFESRKSFLNSEDIAKNSEVYIPQVTLMAKHCVYGYGESGGVILQKIEPAKTEINENAFGEIFGKENEGYETRALCLVEVLQNLRKEEIPGNFFLYLLQQVQEIILNPNFGEIGKMRALVIFNVLALMCEKLGPSVLKNTGHMIKFVDTTLTRAHHVYMESLDEGDWGGAFEMETLTMALGMLSALLSGAVKVDASDYTKLQALTPILREIGENHTEEKITEQANDLLVLIRMKTTVLSEKSKRANAEAKGTEDEKRVSDMDDDGSKWTPNGEPGIDFDTAFEQLCDPLIPVRGHALMRLAVLLKSRDQKALEKVDILVKTFRDSLIHEDSYIYLAAVEGLVAAADVRADDVIPYLAREFSACCGKGTEASGSEQSVDKGEYKKVEKANEKKEFVNRSSSTRLKVGEALVRAVRRAGELAPRYFPILIEVFLVGVRDKEGFIRASSLSNLGELCRLSPQMLPTVIHKVFHCINMVLRSDKTNEVRQAAALVLTLVFRGLGQRAIRVLPDNLKDIYQLLKFVESTDKDEKTRIQAQVALGELETIMTHQLFRKQELVKHISILK